MLFTFVSPQRNPTRFCRVGMIFVGAYASQAHETPTDASAWPYRALECTGCCSQRTARAWRTTAARGLPLRGSSTVGDYLRYHLLPGWRFARCHREVGGPCGISG